MRQHLLLRPIIPGIRPPVHAGWAGFFISEDPKNTFFCVLGTPCARARERKSLKPLISQAFSHPRKFLGTRHSLGGEVVVRSPPIPCPGHPSKGVSQPAGCDKGGPLKRPPLTPPKLLFPRRVAGAAILGDCSSAAKGYSVSLRKGARGFALREHILASEPAAVSLPHPLTSLPLPYRVCPCSRLRLRVRLRCSGSSLSLTRFTAAMA